MLGYIARGMKIANGIKSANQMTLHEEITLIISGTLSNHRCSSQWTREAEEGELERWLHEKDSWYCQL
jgi:hypothetical protein